MNKRTATNILSLRTSAISCLMALSLDNSFAQGITFQTDASTGAIAQLAIDNDEIPQSEICAAVLPVFLKV